MRDRELEDDLEPLDVWEKVVDVSELHRLLIASDLASVLPSGHPPDRNVTSTTRLVQAGAVVGIRRGEVLVAAIALEDHPSYELELSARGELRALYMRRLCVLPAADDPLLAFRLLRRVLRIAREGDYQAIRAEINPQLTEVRTLLDGFGFRTLSDSGHHGDWPTSQVELIL